MLITQLVPAAVRAVEWFGDRPDATVFPGEDGHLRRGDSARRREFATTRACAREALAGLGVRPGPIPVGADRSPGWPAGVVGSLTHCACYRAAAVANSRAVRSVGIDAEPAHPLPRRVLERVTTQAERAALPADIHPLDRVLFSAKETLFKAWYPITRRYLGFLDATVEIRPPHRFLARILVDDCPTSLRGLLTGRYIVERGLVITALTVPHEGERS
ncbi:4'-phosphopantetheinyl transferase family protein [Actinokineospora enzanensis]|uniref:4'-phosphopantetheinyl transferase family protein n=1 Tax=Actinokineospora enzanensis TaxID=155975 RepID=UPI000381EECC|nr:4'-phosphopantetheinyl transferase superfamily protein [Actinokineospora enzanensis]